MIFEQHYLDCLSQASYLIGDERTRRAVVVDPRRDVGVYLDAAARSGLTIELVVETHVHADFVSGHLELAAATGATIAYGPGARTDFHIRHLHDGERIELGDVVLEVLHTPGHTPESICIVVSSGSADGRPAAVLTGDTMFIGDVGRPDLVAGTSDTAERRATQLYDSIHRTLLSLPNETIVYPGHGAGSACGTGLSDVLSSTIGEQRSTSPALAPMTLEQFIARSTERREPPPAYFAVDAALNRQIRPLLDESALINPLTPAEVASRTDAGAVVVDTRDPDTFAQAHLRGSINVPLRARFAELAGNVLSPDRDLIVVCCRGDEREPRNRLARIGLDRVVGYAVDIPADRIARRERLQPGQIDGFADCGASPVLLDVRRPGELDAGAITGAVHIPLGQLLERIDELDPRRTTIVYCASGTRSSVAASLLRAQGFADVVDVVGGYDRWHTDSRD